MEVGGVVGDGCQDVFVERHGECGGGRREGVGGDVGGNVVCRDSCFDEDGTCVIVRGHPQQLFVSLCASGQRGLNVRIGEFAGLREFLGFCSEKNIFGADLLSRCSTTDDDMHTILTSNEIATL